MTDRKTELAENLARVEERISSACAAAGRGRDEVTLIVVTKTYPASDVRLLADLGVRHVAENRDQDAAPKAAACADLPLTWHFVGQLQTNKVRSVAGYAHVVQSVDRPKLVTALSAAAEGPGANSAASCRSPSTPSRGARRPRRRRSGAARRTRGPRGRGPGTAARRSDDRRPAGRGLRGTRTGRFRAAGGIVIPPARGPSDCHDGVGRDECRPGTGRCGRCDTCTRRHCGTRRETPARVTSRRKSDHSRKYGHSR